MPTNQSLTFHRSIRFAGAAGASFALVLLAGCPQPPPPELLFVNGAAAGGSGESWDSAYASLQDALARAAEEPTVREIWVAAGTYRTAASDGARTATFSLVSGVALYGGFIGSETMRDERDPQANPTVLSGDLAGDDDGTRNNDDNALHVVSAIDLSEPATLDGFTIRGGNADATGASSGGGLIIDGASPRIANCVFEENGALNSGGGAVVIDGGPTFERCRFDSNIAVASAGALSLVNASPQISDCRFTDNVAFGNGGAVVTSGSEARFVDCVFEGNSAVAGGAVYNGDRSAPRFEGCEFIDNRAETDGGAIANVVDIAAEFVSCLFERNSAARSGGAMLNSVDADVYVEACRFVGNSASGSGGALSNFSSAPVVVNSEFSGNSAALGGASAQRESSDVLFFNCTFSGNAGSSGAAIHNSFESSPRFTNCILWGNTESGGQNPQLPIRTDTGDPIVNFTCIEGGWDGAGGEGIVAEDPLFADPAGPDSAIGTPDDDLRLQGSSPCIDAGTTQVDVDPKSAGDQRLPATDLDGNPRRVDGDGDGAARVDLGALEVQFMP